MRGDVIIETKRNLSFLKTKGEGGANDAAIGWAKAAVATFTFSRKLSEGVENGGRGAMRVLRSSLSFSTASSPPSFCAHSWSLFSYLLPPFRDTPSLTIPFFVSQGYSIHGGVRVVRGAGCESSATP